MDLATVFTCTDSPFRASSKETQVHVSVLADEPTRHTHEMPTNDKDVMFAGTWTEQNDSY